MAPWERTSSSDVLGMTSVAIGAKTFTTSAAHCTGQQDCASIATCPTHQLWKTCYPAPTSSNSTQNDAIVHWEAALDPDIAEWIGQRLQSALH
jgi:hypothetical protein